MKEIKGIEFWKTIKGYNGLYMVSNLGNVKSLGNDKSRKERILKPYLNNNGYCYVNLSKEGKIKNYTIHRLVATTFLPNPDNLSQVNHKNEDKTDNRVSNLEFCDNRYNSNYGTRNERMAKARQKPIIQLSKDNVYVKQWESATQVERELNINDGHIGDCCKKKRNTSGGYKWMYLEDYLLLNKKAS